MTQIHLPFPPSTNGLYKNRKGGRCKTDKYKQWLVDADEALKKQLKYRRFHSGRVDVSLHLKAPDKSLSDIDNRVKAVLDFLVANNILVGDDWRYVRSVLVRWADEMPVGCYVNVKDCL
jgi:Holliday junction resolvase RusA-like endonuclease